MYRYQFEVRHVCTLVCTSTYFWVHSSLTISPKTKAKITTTLTDMMGGSPPLATSVLREEEAVHEEVRSN